MFTVGRLVGSCSPATDNDGHATKRPSTFFEHRRRLIQPTRKPSDLTNPSTESDQAHPRVHATEERLALPRNDRRTIRARFIYRGSTSSYPTSSLASTFRSKQR
jgi:hypothetical protein